MADTILDSITEKYNSFTRSDKKLANYILANSTSVEYLSITSLAEYSGVSQATISRFCRTLGLSGYNDLKLALAKTEHVTQMGDVQDSPQAIYSDDDLETICRKLGDSYMTSFSETMEQMDNDSVLKAVDLLSDARHVYCFGHGSSMIIAMEAWARFSTVTSKFIHIQDTHMQLTATSLCGPQDVLLLFSYSGSTRESEDILRTAKEHNVPVILVTHFRNSMAAQYADITLFCGYNESPLQSGSVAAKIGQLLIIDCLYYSYCKKNPDSTTAARTSTMDAISRRLL